MSDQLNVLFDHYCTTNDYGRRYKGTDNDPKWFDEIAAQIREEANSSAQVLSRELLSSKVSVHVDIVEYPKVNAFAFAKNGSYFIGFTTSAIRCLYYIADIYARFESANHTYSHTRSCLEATDWTDPWCVEKSITFVNLVNDQIEHPFRLKEVRRARSLFLSLIRVVLYHEFGHLMCGHASFVQAEMALKTVSECHVEEDLEEQELWHAMEIQADTILCMYLVSQHRYRETFDDYIWASIVVFYFLYSLTPSGSNTHPHPLVRLYSLLGRTGNELNILEPELHLEYLNSMLDSIYAKCSRIGLNFVGQRSNLTEPEIEKLASTLEKISIKKYTRMFDSYRFQARHNFSS